MNGDHRLGRPPQRPLCVLGRKVFPPSKVELDPYCAQLRRFETDNHPLPDGTYDPSPGKCPARSTTLAPVPPWADRRNYQKRL